MADQVADPAATQDSQAPAPIPQPEQAAPQKGIAKVNVADYLQGQGLTLAHVGYSDSDKGPQITAKDQDGKLFTVTEKSLKEGLVKNGLLHGDSQVQFAPNSYNSKETPLNEVPTSLDMGDASHFGDTDKMAWSNPAQATQMLLHKLGPDRVAISEEGTAASIQDTDGVWRKIAPDFHDDSGSWNWANTVYNVSRYQKEFATAAAFGLGSAAVEPLAAGASEALGAAGVAEGSAATEAALNYLPKAAASVAGGLTSDATNMFMGRVLGTTGENPDQALKTVALHAAINAVVPGIVDGLAQNAVIPALKFGLNKLGGMGDAAVSTAARLLSMFGDGNATAVEHSLTHAGPVSAAMDDITDSATSAIADANENGRALNKYDAVQQAAGQSIAKAGQAFAGDVQDAGKLSRNLNDWMDQKTSALVSSLDADTKSAIQEKIPVNALVANNSFRQFLGAAGVPVNAAGRVTANDLAASFGSMTPQEAATAAQSMNMGMLTLERLSQFDVNDPSAFKDMATMDASIKNMKNLLPASSMAPQAIQEASKHLDNVSTIMGNGLPVNFRADYQGLMKEYANAGHAVNYVIGGALQSGAQDTMTGAGDRVAKLLLAQQSKDPVLGEMFSSLQKITPGSQQLTSDLQTQLSAGYMFNYSTAPTSTLGGFVARLGGAAVRPILKGAVQGLGNAQNLADTISSSSGGEAARQAANNATQMASNTPVFQSVKSALSDIKSPSDFMDQTKISRVITAYGIYRQSKGQGQ